MLYANNNRNQAVWAKDAIKNKHYRCPFCKCKVILKKGTYNTPHFAHIRNNRSYCHKNESQEHFNLKYHIARELKGLNHKVNIEPYVPQSYQYPDLIIDDEIVLEIQFSKVTTACISKRSKTLQNAGYKVYWITKKVKFNKSNSVLYLSKYERNFINIHNRLLLSWDTTHKILFGYKVINFLGGQQFIAKRHCMTFAQLINQIQIERVYHAPTQPLKLSKIAISTYLRNCRKTHSVLEPSLSVMYNLKLTDAWVNKYIGIIYPEQIYIKSHPVYWQLQLIYLWRTHTFNMTRFKQLIELNHFYNVEIDKTQISHSVVQKFKQFYHNHGCYSVQK
ncbi:hypothetical protein XA22_09540 [Staphylococcus cohnii subsp. cohnii]|uniref:competence protein CoiA n=1 Tax=Staphylococcus TaxID=1279 RepID=UPI0006192610|nr:MULTISPECIES: competence protein CoiA family protein [unclassified Staphylococcus]KKD22849.1 hypothetical protein XA22_09540 [Staphylococcus cohnii subsp. cohnii]KKD24942.1 hypothetical protein XA21_01445 [Staphylococcus cohnii subsp. cohnii]